MNVKSIIRWIKAFAWEMMKFVGVAAWLVGIFTLSPFALGLGVVISIVSITKTRRERHQELLSAIDKDR